MIVEVLYKEFYIYGEKENLDYFEMMMDGADFVQTSYEDKPYFVDHRPDLIIIGPMAERNLDRILEKLLPYRDRIKELMDDGVYFFIMNNAMDIFAKELMEDKKPKKTLGLLDYHANRQLDDRFTKLIQARFQDMDIVASNIGFSQYYGNQNSYIYKVVKGFGFNKGTDLGGFRYKNVFCIETAGAIFVFNPPLSKYILKEFGMDTDLPFEEDAYKAYEFKLKEFEKLD